MCLTDKSNLKYQNHNLVELWCLGKLMVYKDQCYVIQGSNG